MISDSIGNYALNNKSIVKGFGTSTISTLARNFNSIYDSKGDWTLKTDGSNLNNNINAVAALLDATQWIDYKSTDAEWAVGAPTLEMFVASYNATHSDSTTASDLGVSNHTIACDVESDTSPGYKVQLDSGSFLPYISNLGTTAKLDQAIYCGYDGCWWLASPGVFNGDGTEVMHTYTWNDGQLYTYSFTAEFGIRPLVCVPISKIGNGINIKTTGDLYFND